MWHIQIKAKHVKGAHVSKYSKSGNSRPLQFTTINSQRKQVSTNPWDPTRITTPLKVFGKVIGKHKNIWKWITLHMRWLIEQVKSIISSQKSHFYVCCLHIKRIMQMFEVMTGRHSDFRKHLTLFLYYFGNSTQKVIIYFPFVVPMPKAWTMCE